MRAFQKLALAAAIASVPMVGMAMEPLNDDGLASVTGQDGISIGIDLQDLELNMYIEDTDGVDATRSAAGLIAIQDLSISTNGNDITIKIDAGSMAGSGQDTGVLKLNIAAPYIAINEGSQFTIGVVGSDSAIGLRDAAAGWTNVDAAKGEVTSIIKLGDIVLENVELGIELGPQATDFMRISTTSAVDLELANFELTDVNGGGSLFTEQVAINNIELDGTTASIANDGLILELGASQLGGMKVALMGLGFGESGNTAALGNVYIDGLDLGGTKITVAGH